MDPKLWGLLEENQSEDVAALVRLVPQTEPPAALRVIARFGEIVTCRIAPGQLLAVREHPSVRSLKAAHALTPEPALHSEARSTSQRRRRSLLATAGKGVVVGVIDWGCDFTHPNFRRTDGSTRLLAIWDQRGRSRRSPEPYGYGVVHGTRAIDAALQTDDPFGALRYDPADADVDENGTHGTHVLDIAAGRPVRGPGGIAPAADLAFVHLSQLDHGPRNIANSVSLLEAVDFIATLAGERPWVINLSLGSHAGPHDGSTLVEQGLDEIGSRGGVVVQSVGNYYRRPIHASGRLREDEAITLDWDIDPSDETRNELDIWYAGTDRITVRLHTPDGGTLATAPPDSHGTIRYAGREVGRYGHRTHDPNNGDNQVTLIVDPIVAGRWRVSIEPHHIERGTYHAWIERDEAVRGSQSRLTRAELVHTSTTNSISNGHKTITVGAYDARTGEVALFSSAGPTRDGREKPDLAAPGIDIVAARSSDANGDPAELTTKSGTSMAAPHVTGTVAAMLHAAGRKLSIDEVRDILRRTCRPVSGRGAARAGWGELDTRAAVAAARELPRTMNGKRELEWLVEASGAPWAVDGAGVFDALMRGHKQQVALVPFAEVVARPGELGNVQPGDTVIRRAFGEAGIASVEQVVDPGSQRAALDRIVLRPRGKRDQVLGIARRGKTRPQRPALLEDVADGAYLAKPPLVKVTVDRYGLAAQADANVAFEKGNKFTQAASMLIRALVGTNAYSPQLVSDVVSAADIGPTGGLVGDAAGGEPVGRFTVLSASFAIEIVNWLRNTRKLTVYLDDAAMRRLQQAATVEYAWTLGNEDKSLGIRIYRWVDRGVFTHVAWHEPVLVEMLRVATRPSDAARALVQALWARLNAAADPIDQIRADAALTSHMFYRVLWNLEIRNGKQPKDPTVPEDTKPNDRVLYRLVEVCLVRWASLAKEAINSAGARKKLLDQALEDLEILAQTAMALDAGDDAFGTAFGKANAPPFPCRVTSSPELEAPLFAMPPRSEMSCEMHVSYGDVFDAFGSEYVWQLLKLDDGSFRDVDGAGLGTLLGRRLDRQLDYTAADFIRLRSALKDKLGDPGVGAATIADALAIVRCLGTVIKTFFEALTRNPWERTISLGGPGFYMIKAIAQQSSSDGPLVRVPSAAYLLVSVLPAAELAQTYADLELARLKNLEAEIADLQGQLANGEIPDEERPGVEAEIAEYQIETSGDVGAILAHQAEVLTAQRSQITQRADFEIDRDKALRSIDDRVDEIKFLLDRRKSRIEKIKDNPRFRFLGVLVTDMGATARLVLEAAQLAAENGKYRYRVIDTTTKKSGEADGTGNSPMEAITNALLTLLEDSETGFGRGTCAVILPARPELGIYDIQKSVFVVAVNIGSLLSEMIEGVTLLLSVIAILAAPFTAGASLSLLVPLGVIGIIPSAYRIATRVRRGTFDWDLDMALELVNIVGGLIGLGQMGAGAMRMVRLAKGFMILGHGADGLGILLGNIQFLEEIDRLGADTSMSPAQKRAALMGIVANKLVGDGILIGSTLGRRAQHEMDVHGVDPSRFPIDEGPPLPADANVKAPEVWRTTVDPQLHAVEPSLLEKARTDVGRSIVVLRETDPAKLAGHGAEVRYRLDRLGFVDEVYIVLGSAAGVPELKAHAETAKQMMKFMGVIGKARTLIDRARAVLRKRPDLKVGDPAWEARLELEKLPNAMTAYMDAAPERLRNKELTPAQIDEYLAGIREQLAAHEERLHAAAKGPRRGAVAARDAGADARASRYKRIADDVEPGLGAAKGAVTIRDAPAWQEHVSVKPKDAAGRIDVSAPIGASEEMIRTAIQEHADLARRRPADLKASLEQAGPSGQRKTWTAKEEARFRGYADEQPGHSWAFKDGELVYEGEPKRHYDADRGAFADGEGTYPAPYVPNKDAPLPRAATEPPTATKAPAPQVPRRPQPAGRRATRLGEPPPPKEHVAAQFDPALLDAFNQRLKKFRGNDNPHPNPRLSGAEGKLWLSDGEPTRCLKRFYSGKKGSVKLSVDRLAAAKRLVDSVPELAKRAEIAVVYEHGSDWMIRDFDLESVPWDKGPPAAQRARAETLDLLRELPIPTDAAQRDILVVMKERFKEGSANIHWSFSKNKLFFIDPQ